MTLAKNRYRISPVVAKRAILLLALSVIPFTLIHETGHIIGCVAGGYNFKLNLGLMSFTVFCEGLPSNILFYYGFGGGLAAIVSGALAISFRKHKAVLISMLTVAIGQLVTAGVEAFLHNFYVDNFWTPVLSYLVFLPLLVRFGKMTLGMEIKSATIPCPNFLKSTRLMVVLIGVIAFLVIFVDTVTTYYFLSHYKYGVLAEDNLLARMLISSTGFALILGIKTLGVGAMTFVSYTVSKVKRYVPLVNVGLLAILLFYTYVAGNNLQLVLKLLLR